MKRFGNVRAAFVVLGLVPGFFFLEHVGAEGFPLAEGCSGAGPGMPVAPPSVRILRDGGAPFVTVANDGFFVLETYGVPASGLLATTTVSVTTLEGDAVAGTLRAYEGTGRSFVGWSADVPLTDGTTLKAVVKGGTVSGFPALEDQADLHVAGAPAVLAGTALAFGDWVDFRHGVGDSVTCTSTVAGSCSPTATITLPGAEERLLAAYTSYSAPADVLSYTLWEVSVTPDVRVPGLAVPSTQVIVHPSRQPLPLGLLAFAKDSAKYCATLVVKDLRTGESQQSRPCATPEPGSTLVRDYPLERCSSPPSAALTAAWCALNPSSARSECKPPIGADPGPTEEPKPEGPTPQEPKPEDPTPQEPKPEQTASNGDAPLASAPHTSRGCQVGSGGRDAGVSSLLLVALGVASFRRRRGRS